MNTFSRTALAAATAAIGISIAAQAAETVTLQCSTQIMSSPGHGSWAITNPMPITIQIWPQPPTNFIEGFAVRSRAFQQC
jgi:hypothetical protein